MEAPKSIPQDRTLSYEARGVMWYLLSKLDDNTFTIKELRQAGKMGRDRTYRIVSELTQAGYIKPRTAHQGSNGQWEYASYEFGEIPYWWAGGKIPTDHSGYVYLIQAAIGLCKIGRTNAPDNRITSIINNVPFEVDGYDHLIPTADMYLLEAELHTKFKDKHFIGEWFALDANDVEYIKSIGGDA